MGAASVQPALPRLRRDWRRGVPGILRWMRDKTDLANAYDAIFALAGPTVGSEFARFAVHPTGKRLLAESPRSDLNALLADKEWLASLPADSFGRAYLDYLGGEGMGAADYFLEAADLDSQAARHGWPEDVLWFVRHMANSHDLFHIVSGYDRSVVGEIGVVAYTAGQIPLLPLKLIMVQLLLLKPTQPLRWLRFVREAYRNGRETPSLSCVDYAQMLPLSLSVARQEIGARPLGDVHPGGMPAKGALLRQLERNITLV